MIIYNYFTNNTTIDVYFSPDQSNVITVSMPPGNSLDCFGVRYSGQYYQDSGWLEYVAVRSVGGSFFVTPKPNHFSYFMEGFLLALLLASIPIVYKRIVPRGIRVGSYD